MTTPFIRLKKGLIGFTTTLGIVVGALLFAACGQGEDGRDIRVPHAEEETHDAHEDAGGLVVLTAKQIQDAGIKVSAVKVRRISDRLEAPARIVSGETGLAHVGSLVGGRVVRFYVREGDPVQKGTPLAEIESLEIGAMKGDYLRAHATLEQTRAALKRQEQLRDDNIGAQRSVEEARAAMRIAEADLSSISTRLAALGVDPARLIAASGEVLSSRIVVRSPIAGVVTRREVSLGEFVEPSRDIIDVLNGSSIYADAEVSPVYAGRLRAGDAAQVQLADGSIRTAKVRFVAPDVDAASRTVQVRLAVDRPQGLRPEAFVTARFDARTTEGTSAPVVPLVALERDPTGDYVYVQRKAGTFERVAVNLGEVSATDAVVLDGLTGNDPVVDSGVFYLKSARQKGALQEHDH